MKLVFPYPVLVGDVGLKPERVIVDNVPIFINLISDDERVIALHSVKRDWEEIRIELSVTVDADEINAGIWDSPVCVASVRNKRTNMRLTFPMRYETGGRWAGVIELRRGEHVGRCEIDAWIAATVKDVKGRLIGRAGSRWSVDFEAKQPTRQRSIKMVWKNFTEHPFLKEFRDDPWMLDAEADEPVLYLNSSIEGFRALLEHGSGREQKLVREVVAMQIASETWSGLFNTALYAASVEAGGVQWPGGWHEDVLKRMLPDFFPDLSLDEALAELVSRRTRGESGADTQARLMHGVTVRSKKQKTVASTVRALARVTDAEVDA